MLNEFQDSDHAKAHDSEKFHEKFIRNFSD